LSNKIVVFIVVLATLSGVYGLRQTQAKNETENNSLLANERNTIKVYKNSVHSVVNVSNIKVARMGYWGTDTQDVPAGAGSGFVWDDQGHIVTNFHVVSGGDKFSVSFHNDERQYKAKYIGGERKEDIAVLKLEKMPKNLKPLTQGDSDILLVGQKAIAIGNPFGLDSTITEGIVSALGRKILGYGNVKIHNMIQTDSPINPGSSGGPLLNSAGQVVGMNTLIFSGSGTNAGVGFAVPITTIKRTVPQLIKHGRVIRPFLGVVFFDRAYQEQFGINKGLAIKYVYEGSPAEKAGLQGLSRDPYGRYFLGDILLAIDGVSIDSYDKVFHVLDSFKVGDTVELTFIRDEKIVRKKVKLGRN